MAAISWKSAINGDWSDAADWSTDTVPTSGETVTFSVLGPYIVTISSADVANSLTFNTSEAALFENAGSLTIGGALTVESGFVLLNEANTIGSVALSGGVLAFGSADALGDGTVVVSGGELLGTANETLGNALDFSGTSTIAAAHETVLNENASHLTIVGNSTLNFGAVGKDGVIDLNPNNLSIIVGLNGTPITYNVAAGTLKLANSFAEVALSVPGQTMVDAGASLDTGGFILTLSSLLGAGTVTDSGAAATLTLDAANFSGVISGPLSPVVGGSALLSGTNTYTGTTTINTGDTLQLGVGGATGSIGAGAITDSGTLIIDRNNAVTLVNAISGAGSLEQSGTGVTSINTANSYTGGTDLSAGTLAIGNAGALGAGPLSFTGGQLLGTVTETFATPINFLVGGTTTTVAAAPGTTLNLTGSVTFAGDNTVVIGTPGQDGDVVWSGAQPGNTTGIAFDVLDGTLTAGNGNLDNTLLFLAGTTIAAGATLDWAGNAAGLSDLQGAGTVTNSGAAQTMVLNGTTNFSGTISGALSVQFSGSASLSGVENYTGGAVLGGPITVANAGTYDIVSNNGIAGNPANFFINNGLFEKTGGGGVSDVTSDFVNNGTIDVSSGSVQFSGGFTNNGVIFGIVSQSGGVTTISDRPPTQATHTVNVNEAASTGTLSAGDTDPDGSSITVTALSGGTVGSPDAGTYGTLTLNANDTYSYIANNTSAINAVPAGTNPTDTFTYTVSDGQGGTTTETLAVTVQRPPQVADSNVDEWILLDGQWAVSAAPGSMPSGYQVAGVGDFTGNGTSDILWQNSATGDTQEWLLNNGGWAGTVDLGTYPGNFQIAGVGDFTGNGIDDMLWTNSSGGQVGTDIWGLGPNGQWANSVSPGTHPAGYTVAGIGDWTGGGTDGILWYNASTGDTDQWQLSGGQWAASVDLGSHPANATDGASYQISGVGDFFDNGRDGVLWTSVNSDGTVATDIWEFNSSGQWMASVSPGNHPAGYSVVGVGDFTGTGTSDILWYNASTGDADEWLINNGQWAGSIDLGTHPGGFQIAGVGDFNGSGTAGVLWHASF